MNEKSKNVGVNIFNSFFIKGLAIVISLLTIPQYIRYFQNQTILGVWYTILNILTWVTMFDLGLGNGLRNRLTEAIAENNGRKQREYVSSAYIAACAFSFFLIILMAIASYMVDWNRVFNVSTNEITLETLKVSMSIVFVGICIQLMLKLISSILYAIQMSSLVNLLVLITNLILLIYMCFSGNKNPSLVGISIVHAVANIAPLLFTSVALFTGHLRNITPSIKFFKYEYAKDVLKIGVILLWLQVAMMFVACSHSIVISQIISPDAVSEFNVYFKLFNGIASVLILVLIPIWSNVTKAQAEEDFDWILKVSNKLWFLLIIAIVVSTITGIALQAIFNLWLQDETIKTDSIKTLAMICYNLIFVLHNINTSISNGLSYFKVQNICMFIACIIYIPLCIFLNKWLNDWSAVIYATVICLLPYNIVQPVLTKRYILNKKMLSNCSLTKKTERGINDNQVR